MYIKAVQCSDVALRACTEHLMTWSGEDEHIRLLQPHPLKASLQEGRGMGADELHSLRSHSTLVLCAECPCATRKGCTRPTPLNAHVELPVASDTGRYLQVEEWASQHVCCDMHPGPSVAVVHVCTLKEAVTATALLPMAARAEEAGKPELSMF